MGIGLAAWDWGVGSEDWGCGLGIGEWGLGFRVWGLGLSCLRGDAVFAEVEMLPRHDEKGVALVAAGATQGEERPAATARFRVQGLGFRVQGLGFRV